MPIELDRVLSFGEMILGHLQYLGIIVDIDIDWPGIWKKMIEWVKVFSFDIRIEMFQMPIIDYRTYFLCVAVLVPLVLSFLSLMFFKPLSVIIWYVAILAGLASIVIGSYIVSDSTISFGVLSIAPGWAFLAFGGLVFGICLIALIVYILKHKRETMEKIAAYRRRLRRLRRLRKIRVGDVPEEKMRALQAESDDAEQTNSSFDEDASRAWEEAQQMKQIKEPRPGILFYISMLITIVVSVAISLLCLGILNLNSIPLLATSGLNSIVALGKIAGYCFMAVGCVLFVYVFITLFQGGRNMLRRIRIFFDQQFIRIVLFVLLITYIPISQTLFTSWSCQEVTCPAGTTLPYHSKKISAKEVFLSIQNATAQCIPCNFITVGCPWIGENSTYSFSSSTSSSSSESCSCSVELCKEVSAVRFKQDAGIECSEVRTFFGPISIIMGIAFVLGIPLLYYLLVRYHGAFLQQMKARGENLEDRWKNRTRISQNSAKSLYLSFEYKWRYYKVTLLLQKLLVVFCSIFIASHPTILSLSLCVINSALLVLGLMTQPYVSRVMDFLSTACNATLLASSALAALLAFRVNMPQAVFLTVSILNFTIPMIAMAVGFVVEWKMEKIVKAKIAPMNVEEAKKPIIKGAEEEQQEEKRKQEKEENETNESLPQNTHVPVSPRMLFAVDWQLNTQTLKYISTFFILVGILSFISLAIGCVGIFAATKSTSIIGPTSEPMSFEFAKQSEFVGYETWEEFSQNCCCSTGENTTDIPSLEQWTCRNGAVKQRSREILQEDETILSGLELRPFCGATFNRTIVCGINHSNSGWFIVTLCPDIHSFNSIILRTLW